MAIFNLLVNYRMGSMILRAFYVVVLAAVLSSCGTSNIQDIDNGDSVGFSTFHASFPVLEDKEYPRIKIRYTEADEALLEQSVSTGMIINVGDTTYTEPDQIGGNYTLSVTSLGYGDLWVAGDDYDIGWYFGWGQLGMDFLITSAAQPTPNIINENMGGPYYELFVYKDFMTRLKGKLSLSHVMGLGNSTMELVELDVGLAFKLMKNLEIIAGKHIWSFEHSSIDYSSEFALDLEGPYVGINLSF